MRSRGDEVRDCNFLEQAVSHADVDVPSQPAGLTARDGTDDPERPRRVRYDARSATAYVAETGRLLPHLDDCPLHRFAVTGPEHLARERKTAAEDGAPGRFRASPLEPTVQSRRRPSACRRSCPLQRPQPTARLPREGRRRAQIRPATAPHAQSTPRSQRPSGECHTRCRRAPRGGLNSAGSRRERLIDPRTG